MSSRAPVGIKALVDFGDEIDDEAMAYHLVFHADLPKGSHISLICVSSLDGKITSKQRVDRIKSLLPPNTEALEYGVPRLPGINAYTIHNIEDLTDPTSGIFHCPPGHKTIVLQCAPVHNFGENTIKCMAEAKTDSEKNEIMTSMTTEQMHMVVKLFKEYYYFLLGTLGGTTNSSGFARGAAKILFDGAYHAVVIDSATVPKFTPIVASLFGELLRHEILFYGFKTSIGTPIGSNLSFLLQLSGGPAVKPDGKTLENPVLTFNGSRPSGGAKYEAAKTITDITYGDGAFEKILIDTIVVWGDGSHMSYVDKALELFTKYGVNFETPFIIAKHKAVNQNKQSQINGFARTLAATHMITDPSGPAQVYDSNSFTMKYVTEHPILCKCYEKFLDIMNRQGNENTPMSSAYDFAAGLRMVKFINHDMVEFINGNRPGLVGSHNQEPVNWTNDQTEARDPASILKYFRRGAGNDRDTGGAAASD